MRGGRAGMICTSTHLGTLPEAYRWTSIYQEALHPPWWRDQFFEIAYTSTTPCPTELYEIVWAIQLYSLYSVYIIQLYTAFIQLIHYTSLYTPPQSSTFLQHIRNCRWYASPWRSLGMSFALQHHHSTFSKGHIKSFHEQSLVAQC